jgi:hypothetical protein
VEKLAKTIQQLQVRITKLEVYAVSSTSYEVHDEREESTKNIVIRIRSLASECKQVRDRSAEDL